jgi:hypothetical protein
LRHDVRHPETAPDLDQFSARHNHFAAGRKRGQHQPGCCGIVVGHRRGFRPCQCADESFGVRVPMAPAAGVEVVFEVGKPRRHACRRFDRGPGQRSPSEVRVNDDAGGVDHRAK